MTHRINREVTVSAVYFTGKDLKTFPKQIEIEGETAVRFQSGLRYLVKKGAHAINLFDMDTVQGQRYRLQQDGERWILLGRRSLVEGM